jgi:hypothetical protein
MQALRFQYGLSGRIVMNSDKKWPIIGASTRVKMLLGIYNDQLPIKPVIIEDDYKLITGSLPMYTYGNILYLMSKNINLAGTNNNGRELYLSIAYKYNDIIYSECPLISNKQGPWMTIAPSDLSQLNLVVPDF